MGRISLKFGIKILAIFGFTLVLGFFILPNSTKAQGCTDLGYICGHTEDLPCCSGLDCVSNRCVKPLGSYCSSRDDCHTPQYGGDTYIMGCFNNECCGRHWYPCSGNSDCCQDPYGDGAFYCMGNNVCGGWCSDPYCTDWVIHNCGDGGCGTKERWHTRTCTNGICDLTECVYDCTCDTAIAKKCYNDDLWNYDNCTPGNRTTMANDCVADSCGSWYDCTATDGCYDTRYKKECQNCIDGGCAINQCFANSYKNNRQGTDCGTNYCEAWVNAGCSGNFIRETRTCHNRGCASGACFDTTYTETRTTTNCATSYCDNWVNAGCNGTYIRETRTCHNGICANGACSDAPYTEERNTTNCATSYCDNWQVCGCDGDFIKECRTCHNGICASGACSDSPYTEERRSSTNCNNSDKCAGNTFQDFSCSNGACISQDQACDSRCNTPPSIPTLKNPINNQWINHDPIFQATVYKSGGGNVRAHFNLLNNPDGTGNWVKDNEVSAWGPVNLGGTCIDEWWQARAEDDCNFFSDWSGWFRVKMDKDLPVSSISYQTGLINKVNFFVSLSANDNCSPINAGNVDVSVDHGATWTNNDLPNNGDTITSFYFVGTPGQCYQLRYQAKDSAENWSDFSVGGETCIDISIPTASIDYPNGWVTTNTFNVVLTEADPGGPITQGYVEIRGKDPLYINWSLWTSYLNTVDDFSFTGKNCFSNKFRYQVVDNAGNISTWADPGYIARIDAVKPIADINYPFGITNATAFTVNLSDSDDCSGVGERDLEISIDNGGWQDYGFSGNSFTYIGSYNHTYKLRYRVRDVAGNWSDYKEGGVIELKALPTAAPSETSWAFCPDIRLTLKWNYSDINNFGQTSLRIQIDDNKNFSSPVLDTNQINNSGQQYTLSADEFAKLLNQTKYYWQVKVRNSAGDWSLWGFDQNLNIFFKALENYSTF